MVSNWRNLAYHIQHSNKLVYSRQHFVQAPLQTQNLGEISKIKISEKSYFLHKSRTSLNELSRHRTCVFCPLEIKPAEQVRAGIQKIF